MGRRWLLRISSGCSPTTPAAGWCATPTPATRRPSGGHGEGAAPADARVRGLTVPYPLNDTQRAMRQVIRDFCRNEVMPGAAERDRTGAFPAEIMRGLGEIGRAH